MATEEVINGVRVIADGDVTHFVPVEDDPKKDSNQKPQKEKRSGWLGSLIDWWDGLTVKPYAKVRDLSDPFCDRTDYDQGSDGKSAVEIGLKWEW